MMLIFLLINGDHSKFNDVNDDCIETVLNLEFDVAMIGHAIIL